MTELEQWPEFGYEGGVVAVEGRVWWDVLAGEQHVVYLSGLWLVEFDAMKMRYHKSAVLLDQLPEWWHQGYNKLHTVTNFS